MSHSALILVFDIITLLAIFVAALMLFAAYRRLLPGDVSRIVALIAYSFVFLAIYKLVEEVGEFVPSLEEPTFWLHHGAFLAATIMAAWAALRILDFAKTYGLKGRASTR